MCSISIRDGELREAVLTDEDVEEDPDHWCSFTECGQELLNWWKLHHYSVDELPRKPWRSF